MDVMDLLTKRLGKRSARFLSFAERYLRAIPVVERTIQKQYDQLMTGLEPALKPYKEDFPTYTHIPEEGCAREDIIRHMEALKSAETSRWKDGYVSGAVYHGDDEHIEFLNRVYAINSQSNPLHADVWPSATKFEAEVVAMTAHMLGADEAASTPGADDTICGTVSSGGTESILLAIKSYRDWARDKKRISRPEMVVPITAHAAFDKAAEYFNIKMKRIPVDADYKADVSAAQEAINKNTIVIVGSAPSFPHGVIDSVDALSDLARKNGIGFHTDACLGGFVLPWAEKLGYDVPPFDFRLPGVTSISADTHKYGYAAKGTSVILYRGLELRRYQYFTTADWPGGLYLSPTFAGSRPGALSAACWAAMVAVGEQGYLKATQSILETAAAIKAGITGIPELHILGDPLWVIAFGSETLDIYRVMDNMTHRGWNLNGLHKPPCVHICVTLRHTQPGVAERFLRDLRAAVAYVKENPAEEGGMAPVYGMAAAMPMRGVVNDMLKRYLDLLFKT